MAVLYAPKDLNVPKDPLSLCPVYSTRHFPQNKARLRVRIVQQAISAITETSILSSAKSGATLYKEMESVTPARLEKSV